MNAWQPGDWFGPNGPWNDGGRHVPTPVGATCLLCGTTITIIDEGSFFAGGADPAHRECLLRSALGGYGHHADHAYWCVERGDPDGGLSYRDSALAVDRLVRAGRIGA